MSSSNSDPKTATTATFFTALVFNGIVFAAQFAAFFLLKPYFKRIYEPRALEHHIHPLSFLSWPIQIYQSDHRVCPRSIHPNLTYCLAGNPACQWIRQLRFCEIPEDARQNILSYLDYQLGGAPTSYCC